VRFSDVFKWATGVLNEKDEITFLKRYCTVRDTGNLCHLPDSVIKPLKKSYFEQCDTANVSQQERQKLKTEAKFADVLKSLQVGRKAFYICRNDQHLFDTAKAGGNTNDIPLSNLNHWFYKALRNRCNMLDTFNAVTRFTSKWSPTFDDKMIKLAELEKLKKDAKAEKAAREKEAADAVAAAAAAARADKPGPRTRSASGALKAPPKRDSDLTLETASAPKKAKKAPKGQKDPAKEHPGIEVIHFPDKGPMWAQLTNYGAIGWNGDKCTCCLLRISRRPLLVS
jgi:hypothetical protein